jgi:hypothetical protein
VAGAFLATACGSDDSVPDSSDVAAATVELKQVWWQPVDGTAEGLVSVGDAALSGDQAFVIDTVSRQLLTFDLKTGAVTPRPLPRFDTGETPDLVAMSRDGLKLASQLGATCIDVALPDWEVSSECEIGARLLGRRTGVSLAADGSQLVTGAFRNGPDQLVMLSASGRVEWSLGTPRHVPQPVDSARLGYGAGHAVVLGDGALLADVSPPNLWWLENGVRTAVLAAEDDPAERFYVRTEGGGMVLPDMFNRTTGVAALGDFALHGAYAPDADQTTLSVILDGGRVGPQVTLPFMFKPLAGSSGGFLLAERWIDGPEIALYRASIETRGPGSLLVVEPEWEIGTVESPTRPGQSFGRLGQILATPDGGLLTLDIATRVVEAFDSAGLRIKAIGRVGRGPGEFSAPVSLAVTDTKIIVRDVASGVYHLFDSTGEFHGLVRSGPARGAAREPMWTDASGRVYDVRRYDSPEDNAGPNRLYTFDPVSDTVLTAAALLPTSSGFATIPVLGGDREVLGFVYSPFVPRFSWTVDRQGRLLTSDGARPVIRVSSATSETEEVAEWQLIPRRTPISDSVRRSERERVAEVLDFIAEEGPLPRSERTRVLAEATDHDTWPEIMGLYAGPAGYVWVNTVPPTRGLLGFVVLNAEGEELAEVAFRLPEGLSHIQGLVSVGGRFVFVGAFSDLGVNSVLAYRIPDFARHVEVTPGS